MNIQLNYWGLSKSRNNIPSDSTGITDARWTNKYWNRRLSTSHIEQAKKVNNQRNSSRQYKKQLGEHAEKVNEQEPEVLASGIAKENTTISFNHLNKTVAIPFVMYSDFKALLKNIEKKDI